MNADITVHAPADDAEWSAFMATLQPASTKPNALLSTLVERLRRAGAVSIIQECSYIDRDFSASYSEFYSTLFQPYRKLCRRLHFFGADVRAAFNTGQADRRVAALEGHREAYLGNIVLRPVDHAPISSAHLSAQGLAGAPGQEIHVRSRYEFHFLGIQFEVDAAPLTQQDTQTGACAQAAVWMAGRHLHSRRSTPWFSVVDITKIALQPIDSGVTRALPAGSEWLTNDNVVRALRAMGRHPVTYTPDSSGKWSKQPAAAIIHRYLDSGIPVLLGLQRSGDSLGHAVLAVGIERGAPPANATTVADLASHILVNDDQRGPYCRLPVRAREPGYPFSLENDLKMIFVPLPAKVFMKAEAAELASSNALIQLASARLDLAKRALGAGTRWNVNPSFYADVAASRLVTRTYLTFGWRYKSRALRNRISEHLKDVLLATQFPRFVWVTEYYRAGTAMPPDPCAREVSAHTVIDATGSRFSEWPLVLDAPGLHLVSRFDPGGREPSSRRSVFLGRAFATYWPKIRGKSDYGHCKAP